MRAAMPPTFGILFAKLCAINRDLEHVRTMLAGANVMALGALARLQAYQDALGRTRAFCARCSTATELQDLDNMVRARDQLRADFREIERLWPKP